MNMRVDIHPASWLFVPGSRPDRFEKAAAAGAHEVIIDLEDAVAPSAKRPAREATAEWLSRGGAAWVRVNAAGTSWHDDDVAALSRCAGLRGIVLPKVEEPGVPKALARRLPSRMPILALLETAAGIRYAYAIADCEAVGRLAFGSIDFAVDIDADETDQALLLARSTLVVASRAAGLPAPLDGVTRTTSDVAAVSADADRAQQLGFGGKLCVHPLQIPPVNRAFAPSDADLDWACKVLAHRSQDAFAVEGQMVDQPVLARATRIVARARQTVQ
jgi:citrate lyase subunit beta / citryl-CoA lyase